MEDRWCILRTGGARTLALAASLNEHGVRAWTPTTIARRRKSRHSTTFVDRDAPLMPTFVFADADRLADLYRFERSTRSPHPAYSIFRYEHRIPIITDAAIDRLRESEARSIPKAKRPTAAVGSTVRLDEGPYAGMDGVVRSSDGNYTLVAFGGWMQVKIETFILLSNAVDQAA